MKQAAFIRKNAAVLHHRHYYTRSTLQANGAMKRPAKQLIPDPGGSKKGKGGGRICEQGQESQAIAVSVESMPLIVLKQLAC